VGNGIRDLHQCARYRRRWRRRGVPTPRHRYWNLSLAGNFDTARAVNHRIHITDGGRTNVGGVIGGPSGDFPAMHGGAQFNHEANANLTTT